LYNVPSIYKEKIINKGLPRTNITSLTTHSEQQNITVQAKHLAGKKKTLSLKNLSLNSFTYSSLHVFFHDQLSCTPQSHSSGRAASLRQAQQKRGYK